MESSGSRVEREPVVLTPGPWQEAGRHGPCMG